MDELARQLGLTDEELRAKIANVHARGRRSSAKRKAATFSVSELVRGRPDIGGQLELLDARFDNRTFLKELRDVKRFLERHGRLPHTVKSREGVKGRVFEVLASLEAGELALLVENDVSHSGSSLGLISDQILRRSKE